MRTDWGFGVSAACSGFLLAVLWMDLIFDVQVLARRRRDVLPEAVIDSIADYYRRATTTSRPMSLLIAGVMLILLGQLGFRVMMGRDPGWLQTALLLLGAGPIVLALLRTVPRAVRLGTSAAADAVESTKMARAICRDHLLCFAAMSGYLALVLTT